MSMKTFRAEILTIFSLLFWKINAFILNLRDLLQYSRNLFTILTDIHIKSSSIDLLAYSPICSMHSFILITYILWSNILIKYSFFRLGQGWEDPVHSDPLVEITELCPKIVEPTPQEPKTSSTLTLNTEEKNSTSPSKEVISGQSAEAISGQAADATSGSGHSADAISGQSADAISGQAADATSSSTGNEKPKASSLSNEDLAKMWQPKSRPSLAQRLKCKWILKKPSE